MTSRELPIAEWPKLDGTELGSVWRVFDPDQTRVIVVEDDGQIVGCWSLFNVVHCEGIWIAPDHRKQGAVARRLLRMLTMTARSMGARAVVTSALTENVADLAKRIGANPLPGEHFVMPIRQERTLCPQP